MGLIVKNIGGARKGVEDMGTLGNPGKYSLVLGENEEESPWDPYHVGKGYKKEDNTLTVFFPNRYTMTVPPETNAEGLAKSLARMRPGALSALIVIPDHAKIFKSESWTKQQVKDFVIKQSSSPTAGGIMGSNARRGRGLQNEDFMLVVAGGREYGRGCCKVQAASRTALLPGRSTCRRIGTSLSRNTRILFPITLGISHGFRVSIEGTRSGSGPQPSTETRTPRL